MYAHEKAGFEGATSRIRRSASDDSRTLSTEPSISDASSGGSGNETTEVCISSLPFFSVAASVEPEACLSLGDFNPRIAFLTSCSGVGAAVDESTACNNSPFNTIRVERDETK